MYSLVATPKLCNVLFAKYYAVHIINKKYILEDHYFYVKIVKLFFFGKNSICQF